MIDMGNWAYGEWGIVGTLVLMLTGAILWMRAVHREARADREATAAGAGADLSWGDTLDDILSHRREIAGRAERRHLTPAGRLRTEADTDVINARDLRLRIALDDIELALSAGLTAVCDRAYARALGLPLTDATPAG